MSYCPGVYPANTGSVAPPALLVLTSSLPTAYVGVPYTATLQAEGGTAPYAWDLAAGSLPAWATLNASTTLTTTITGTPNAAGTSGLTPRITDAAAATATNGSLSLTAEVVSGVLAITTSSLAAANRGQAYAQPLAASGGTPAYVWTDPGATLPAGLSISGAQIVGTSNVAGASSVTLRVTDAAAAFVERSYTLTVNQVADLAITSSAALPQAEQGVAYNRTLQTSGGWGAVTWAVISGALPSGGLSLNASSGAITGTPNTVQTALFRVRATDSEGRVAERDMSIGVVAAGTLEGPHAFFDNLVASPEHLVSHTLRSDASITALGSAQPVSSGFWRYVFGSDPYHTPQDGAKCIMGRTLSGANQLRWDIRGIAGEEGIGPRTGAYTFYIDVWFGPECHTHVSQTLGLNHKFQQFRARNTTGSPGSIWCEPRIYYRPFLYTLPEFGSRNLRTYIGGAPDNNALTGEGLLRHTSYEPTGEGAALSNTVVQKSGMWTRQVYHWELDQPGTAFTSWAAAYNGGVPIGTRALTSSVYEVWDHLQTLRIDNVADTNVLRLTFGGQSVDMLGSEIRAAGNASALIEAALESLSTIPVDALTVTQPVAGRHAYDISFGGTFAGVSQALLVAQRISGSSGLAPAVYEKVPGGLNTTLTVASYAQWPDWDIHTKGPNITIAGHSNGGLNGTHYRAAHVNNTTLVIPGNGSGGTGGTVSKHFHMFSWYMATEDQDPFRVFFEVPLIRWWDDITDFDQELNTSDGEDAMVGYWISASPTVANPTVITTATPHDLVTGDFVLCAGNSTRIPQTPFAVTVLSSTTFSIPVHVLSETPIFTSGFFNGTYGRVSRTLTYYFRNLCVRDGVDFDINNPDHIRRPV